MVSEAPNQDNVRHWLDKTSRLSYVSNYTSRKYMEVFRPNVNQTTRQMDKGKFEHVRLSSLHLTFHELQTWSVAGPVAPKASCDLVRLVSGQSGPEISRRLWGIKFINFLVTIENTCRNPQFNVCQNADNQILSNGHQHNRNITTVNEKERLFTSLMSLYMKCTLWKYILVW